MLKLVCSISAVLLLVASNYTACEKATLDPLNDTEDLVHIEEPTPQPIETVETEILETPTPTPEPKEIHMGDNWLLTHYDACVKCCGKTNGITASGRKAELNVTIAGDPKMFPLGTYVRIEIPKKDGTYQVYRSRARVDDRGGSVRGRKLDVYVSTHDEALSKGVIKNARVYILKE